MRPAMTTLAAIYVRNLTPVEPVRCRTLVARESLIKLVAFFRFSSSSRPLLFHNDKSRSFRAARCFMIYFYNERPLFIFSHPPKHQKSLTLKRGRRLLKVSSSDAFHGPANAISAKPANKCSKRFDFLCGQWKNETINCVYFWPEISWQ